MTRSGKVPWSGVLTSIQPRIRLTRSFDQRSHTYQGYVLRVSGTVGDEAREVTVAIGEAAHAKHGFQAGDTVLEIIFGLLRSIDDEPDEIIFFADEAGAWQVGVDWLEVLPVWYRCLSATAEPEEYARRVVEVVDQHDSYDRAKHFTAARKAGTPAQAKALGPQRRRKKATR